MTARILVYLSNFFSAFPHLLLFPFLASQDLDLGSDLALSFQDSEACHALWDSLLRVQDSLRRAETEAGDRLTAGDANEASRGADIGYSDGGSGVGSSAGKGVVSSSAMGGLGSKPKVGVVDELESSEPDLFRAGASDMSGSGDGSESSGAGGDMGLGGGMLPPPEIGNLKALAKALSDLNVPGNRERLATAARTSDFLPRLFQTFQECEDIEVQKAAASKR